MSGQERSSKLNGPHQETSRKERNMATERNVWVELLQQQIAAVIQKFHKIESCLIIDKHDK